MPRVTDPALLEELNGQGAQSSAPEFPGVVRGRERPVDPVEQRRDEIGLSRDEIALQRERLALEKQRAETAAGELSSKLGKEAGFYLRARSAGEYFDTLGVGAESQGRAFAKGVLPADWMNAMTDKDRQQAETYMEDFIAASLRYESGASIGKDEFDRQARIYFPQPGDSDETLEAKAQLRRNMIQSLGMGAGPEAVKEVDDYLEATRKTPIAFGAEEPEGPETFERGFTDKDGNPLPDNTPLSEDVYRNGEYLLRGRVSSDEESTRERMAREAAEAQRAQQVEFGGEANGALSDAATLGKQGITLGLSDEASGLGGALSGIFNGKGVVEGYKQARDQERARIDIARDNLGYGGTAIELAGGGAGVIGKAGQVMAAGRNVARAGNPLNRSAVQSQLTRTATKDGAKIGALGGFGYGEGLEGSAINAAGGTVLGGALGNAGQRVGNALANRATPRRDASALAEAGRAEGVTVNRAMADPNSGNAVSRADASILGGRKVQREMEAIEGQVEAGVERLGRSGQALDRTATGERVTRAGERVIEQTRGVTDRKYKAAERMAGDVKIRPARARTAAQGMIRDLSETANTNSAEITFLRGLVEDFQKPLSISALRDLRTSLRKKISKGDLVFGQNEARVLQIMDEAAQDISTGLKQAGKTQAASAFDAADTAYAARMDLIETTIQKMIGKRGQSLSAEQVAARLNSAAKTDAVALRKLWTQLGPSERSDLQATFAQALGRNNKGEFSPAIFLSNVGGANRKMSDRAMRVVFGKDGSESIQNLKRLATEVNRVTSAMNSRTSKSGVAGSAKEWLLSLLLGSGPGAIAGNVSTTVATAGAGLAIKGGTEILSARALMSPKIQKWLLQAPNTTNPRAIDAHFNRLAGIAKAEPALAGDIEILRKGILGAANDNASAGSGLAAEDQNAQER